MLPPPIPIIPEGAYVNSAFIFLTILSTCSVFGSCAVETNSNLSLNLKFILLMNSWLFLKTSSTININGALSFRSGEMMDVNWSKLPLPKTTLGTIGKFRYLLLTEIFLVSFNTLFALTRSSGVSISIPWVFEMAIFIFFPYSK